MLGEHSIMMAQHRMPYSGCRSQANIIIIVPFWNFNALNMLNERDKSARKVRKVH